MGMGQISSSYLQPSWERFAHALDTRALTALPGVPTTDSLRSCYTNTLVTPRPTECNLSLTTFPYYRTEETHLFKQEE